MCRIIRRSSAPFQVLTIVQEGVHVEIPRHPREFQGVGSQGWRGPALNEILVHIRSRADVGMEGLIWDIEHPAMGRGVAVSMLWRRRGVACGGMSRLERKSTDLRYRSGNTEYQRPPTLTPFICP